MPFKDHQKQLGYLRAWRVKHAAEIRQKKHAYYLEYREDIAARRRRTARALGSKEGRNESKLLRSSRDLARWRDVAGEARLPVRRGRRRKYLGKKTERHAQAQRIYRAKRKARVNKSTPLEGSA